MPAAFRAAYDDTHVSFEFKLGDAAKLTVDPEFRLFWPQPTVEISKDGPCSRAINLVLVLLDIR